MAEFYISNNGDITDSCLYLPKQILSISKIHSTLPPSPITQTPGPTRSPSTAILGILDSQVTLLNFKKGTKRDSSAYPTFKSEKYYDTFCCSFHPTQGHKALGTFSTPNSIPNTVTPLLNCFLVSSSPSCTLF